MCLSIPLQVVAIEGPVGDFAIAERRQGQSLRRERINMLLIGPQPLGTWILASLGWAREVIDDRQRTLIEDALAALAAARSDRYDAGRHFLDLDGHDQRR